MSLKDIFNSENKKKNNLTTVHYESLSALTSGSSEVESVGFIEQSNIEQARFLPAVDYATASNFVKYGLAEHYYEQSINRILNFYPYDGSLKEKKEWRNNSTPLDLHIFDNEYPKSSGYVTFGLTGSFGNGDVYAMPTIPEYIQVVGGPNVDNVFDASNNQEENLKFNYFQGNTIEFWMKKDAFVDYSQSRNEVIFDLRNQEDTQRFVIGMSEQDYGANQLYLRHYYTSAGTYFQLYDESIAIIAAGSIADGQWHHYSIVLSGDTVGASTTINTKLYFDGELADSQTATTVVSTTPQLFLTGSGLIATIGALGGEIETTGSSAPGRAKLSGSLDDFRFWKEARTAKEIGRDFITSEIGGGTNTDLANTTLGLHFKFNEGTSNDSAIDQTILDYSGRVSNGTFHGYSSQCRSTGSAMVESGFATFEIKDPIMYANSPDVVSFKTAKMLAGSEYDYQNGSSLYKSFPAWIVDEDGEAQNTLRDLCQIMASYLDELYLQIQFLPNLKQVDYTAEDGKPHNFYRQQIENLGLSIPELFADVTPFVRYLQRDEKVLFEKDVNEIKNRIYQNIYNNLTTILKAKGNEKSFRNFIRCFGVDDEIYKINLYSDNADYKLEPRYAQATKKKNFINFNTADNFGAVIYNHIDNTNPNSKACISGTYNVSSIEMYVANTCECEFIFPLKPEPGEPNFIDYQDISSSLFGIVGSVNADPNFEIYAEREEAYSKNVKFVLTSSVSGGFALTSPTFDNVYNDQRWNFAVRIKPENYDQADLAAVASTYQIELYGVSAIGETKIEEFSVSGAIEGWRGLAMLSMPRSLYVGAKRDNLSGSLATRTDVEAGSTRLWFDYLNDETVYQNAIQADSEGNEFAYKNVFLSQTALNDTFVPSVDALALNWRFNQVTGSDSNGQFLVIDNSSGSIADGLQKYGEIGGILKSQYTAIGDFFEPLSKVTKKEYLPVLRKKHPEQISTDDTVQILHEDDLQFTKESRPIRTFISIERSMYQTISDEMLKIMATIKDFNNLIGEPVSRYRHEYKQMNKLRSLFFESIGNTPDLEKYVEYYKWLDIALDKTIEDLFPASANISEHVNTMIESHVLERSKVKVPYSNFKNNNHLQPQGDIQGSNKLALDWKISHAPVGLQENTGSFWWNHFAEPDGPTLTSSCAAVNASKNSIHSAIASALRQQFATPLRANLEQLRTLAGGVNIQNRKFDFYRSARNGGILLGILPHLDGNSLTTVDTSDYEDLRVKPYNLKPLLQLSQSGSSDNYKINSIAPFDGLSAERNPPDFANSFLSNVQNEQYGADYEIPMQGPFADKWSGGSAHRHQQIGTSGSQRAEAFQIGVVGNDNLVINPFELNVNQARSDFYRDFTAKTAYVFKNIKITTGSQGETIGGNFSKNYEVFQTSGRRTNNGWFVRNNGIVQPTSLNPYFVTATEFALPTRTRQESVFVQRFSSPGDPNTMREGCLDTMAAEISVYNALPYRNLMVRVPYAAKLAIASSFGGFDSGSLTVANVHKIPANALSSSTGKVTNDNYWVQHSIPQDDKNFTSSSHISPSGSLMLKVQKENNIVSLFKKGKSLTAGSGIVYEADSNVDYREPPIVSKYGPIQYKFIVENNWNGVKSLSEMHLKLPLGNHMAYFSNKELNDATVSLNGHPVPNTAYDQLLPMYTDPSVMSPIKNVVEIKYKETIYPREANTYLSGTRSRLNYAESAEQLKSADRRTFWRDDPKNRIQAQMTNSQGYVMDYLSVFPLDAGFFTNEPLGELNKSLVLTTSSCRFVSSFGDVSAYQANVQAGVNPFYDSYENFSQDIITNGKDHTLIPEFRMSQHMDYFANQNSLNFDTLALEDNLSLDGCALSSSAQQNFYKAYSHSDFIKNFGSIEKDNEKLGLLKEIKLTVGGIKKMLPYNGFYPVLRSLELSSLFSSSYSGTISGDITISGSAPIPAGVGSLFPLFYSPGLFYNVIKSGLAVDYPAHTGSVTYDEFSAVNTQADYRIPFEAVITPKTNLRENEEIKFIDDDTLFSSYWTGGSNNSLYSLASNNFFGESTRFFLGSNQTFTSSPENKFSILEKGKTYYLDVSLKRTQDLVMYVGAFGENGSPYGTFYSGSYNSGSHFSEPYWLASTPPYFYGTSAARLSFTPDTSKQYSAQEILTGVSVEYFNSLQFDDVKTNLVPGSAASASIMNIGASVNFKGITTTKQIAYKIDSNGNSVPDTAYDMQGGTGFDVWRISPKYETPIFNFAGESTGSNSGMWNHYRSDQSGPDGIYLEISNPFPQKTNAANSTTGSLMDACGFDLNNSSKKLGQLNNSKEISEAVVAIPFKPNGDRYTLNPDTWAMLKNPKGEKGGTPVPAKSLKDMYERMQNYIFPPHLDFLNNPTVKPYGMYIFEFKHTLSKTDLAKIWQGVMPEIATKAELDQVSIRHPFAPGEIFDNDFDPETRWIVFKVKKRAEFNYYAVTADSKDDTRFDFNFKIGGNSLNTKNQSLPYSYNWPYDFFSLVELAKIDAEIIYSKPSGSK